MRTGRTLFVGRSLTEVMLRIIQVDDTVRSSRSWRRPTILAGLGAVMGRLLVKDQDERYPNAAALANELMVCASGSRSADHRGDPRGGERAAGALRHWALGLRTAAESSPSAAVSGAKCRLWSRAPPGPFLSAASVSARGVRAAADGFPAHRAGGGDRRDDQVERWRVGPGDD